MEARLSGTYMCAAPLRLCGPAERTLLYLSFAALLSRTLLTGQPTLAFICWNLVLDRKSVV